MDQAQAYGIIPARAGFTACDRPSRPDRPDHPRSRGVYGHTTTPVPVTGGSSPLARGLRFRDIIADGRNGIIPARAGFTRPPRLHAGQRRDHPRSRGVYLPCATTYPTELGSSPLARGLRRSRHSTPTGRGIIPARAGFTFPRAATGAPQKDHPRSRGVYAANVFARLPIDGSSPLARGLQSESR